MIYKERLHVIAHLIVSSQHKGIKLIIWPIIVQVRIQIANALILFNFHLTQLHIVL